MVRKRREIEKKIYEIGNICIWCFNYDWLVKLIETIQKDEFS